MVKVEELLLLLLQLSAVETVNSVAVGGSLWVLVVCITRHHWEMVVAVKMFIVIMTF